MKAFVMKGLTKYRALYMAKIISRSEAPGHLFNISDLDFSEDLFAERVSVPWFRLAAWTITPRRDERGLEDAIFRQTLMLAPASFAKIFDQFESVGNAIGDLGKPSDYVTHQGNAKEYGYAPFYRFELLHTPELGNPCTS
jgi:hypothetical protein